MSRRDVCLWIYWVLNAAILSVLAGPNMLRWVRCRDYAGAAKMEVKIIS